MRRLYTPILFTLLAGSAHAQIYPIRNPSFEGKAGQRVTPPEWFSTNGDPNLMPYGDTVGVARATDGKIYLMILYEKKNAERTPSIGQILSKPLMSGRTYRFSFDLVHPGTMVVDTDYSTCRITGGDKYGGQLIYESGRVPDGPWRKVNVVFNTTRDVSYIIIAPYIIKEDSVSTMLAIDNFSNIEEIINLQFSADGACPGESNGSIAVNIPNAYDTYTYLWEPGGYTTPVVHGLPAGTYKVTVKSGGGITTSGEVEVKTEDIKLSLHVAPVSCFGKTDAVVQMQVDGGKFPYTYSMNETYSQDSVFKNVAPGAYAVTITDQQQCILKRDIDIAEPALLQLEETHTVPVICTSAKNGQIVLTPKGGTPPYTYSIPDVVSQKENTLRQLDEGTYQYMIQDSHNCTIKGEAIVDRDMRYCMVYVPTAFTPNGDGINDVFRVKLQDDVKDFQIAVYRYSGELVYKSNDPYTGWNGKYKDTLLPSGGYYWVITYKDYKNQLLKQQGNVIMLY